jgi:diadenosine tetraphosphate (Ap4A) HIT family hydrolase
MKTNINFGLAIASQTSDSMPIIFESPNFIVESAEKPFVSRTDGGDIRIKIKDQSITDRTKITPKVAIEFMRLTMIVGEAMEIVMNQQGIPVVKINYQDMGNWAYKRGEKPFFHIHIFGRAKNAVYQPFPEAVYLPDRSTGFYDSFEPLNENDVKEIKKYIEKLFKETRFSDKEWGI